MENEPSWSKVLDPMVPSSAPAPGVYTVLGPWLLPSWFLRALCPAISQGARIYWIDAGNSFDAYGISRTARALGLDPRGVLSKISLARPFNVFQLETMMRSKLPASWRGEPVVLSDPLGPFYDEELPYKDARKALPGVLEALDKLPAVWLVLAVERKAPKGREEVLRAFLQRSERLVLLAQDGKSFRLRALQRKGEPWDALCRP